MRTTQAGNARVLRAGPVRASHRFGVSSRVPTSAEVRTMEDDDTSRWRPALEPWLRDLGESSGVAFARASPRESEHGRGLFATSDGVDVGDVVLSVPKKLALVVQADRGLTHILYSSPPPPPPDYSTPPSARAEAPRRVSRAASSPRAIRGCSRRARPSRPRRLR